MTTEEKAKAYDEALERAKEYHDVDKDNTLQVYARGVMEYLFPKLKENEDERIRNLLYCLIRDGIYSEKLLKYNGVSVDMVLAWLEKQGEQKQMATQESKPKFKVGDIIRNKENGDTVKIDGVLSNSYYYSGFDGAATIHSDFSISKQDEWELVEQKPTDKVGPKFEVGDWIVCCDYEPVQIIDITSEMYHWSNGDIRPIEAIDSNPNIHLWNIKDAKPGDVLAYDNGNICIFDGTVEEGIYPFAHCGITRYGFETCDRRLPFSHDNNVHLATKEQRELLFTKMKEAGYKWDAEKLELKKI